MGQYAPYNRKNRVWLKNLSNQDTLSGTPLARQRHKDKWLEYAQQIASGQSLRTSAKVCDMHRNTAFRWRHRFLKLPNEQKAASLVGIAEADETFFLEGYVIVS